MRTGGSGEGSTLVLGAPGRVAVGAAMRLRAMGPVVVLVPPGQELPELEGVEGISLFEGETSAIDLGLSGAEYLAVARRCQRIVHAIETRTAETSIESSSAVRGAAELCELVAAGAGGDGVIFLSSLLVFGNYGGIASERELAVGQRFLETLEEALATAEKMVTGLRSHAPVSIIRSAPLAGELPAGESRGWLYADSPLARLARRIQVASPDALWEFHDAPVRFESTERVVEAAVRLLSTPGSHTVHLLDADPPTDRQLVSWLATRYGRTIQVAPSGARTRGIELKDVAAARTVTGWRTRFERYEAERILSGLLDRPWTDVLAGFFGPLPDARDDAETHADRSE